MEVAKTHVCKLVTQEAGDMIQLESWRPENPVGAAGCGAAVQILDLSLKALKPEQHV